MRTLTKEHVDEVVRRLVEALGPERIYLFGSQASGTAGDDSDILIVVPDGVENDSELYAAAEKCLRGTCLPVEMVVLTHRQFEREKGWICSVAHTVASRGRLLYAR